MIKRCNAASTATKLFNFKFTAVSPVHQKTKLKGTIAPTIKMLHNKTLQVDAA